MFLVRRSKMAAQEFCIACDPLVHLGMLDEGHERIGAVSCVEPLPKLCRRKTGGGRLIFGIGRPIAAMCQKIIQRRARAGHARAFLQPRIPRPGQRAFFITECLSIEREPGGLLQFSRCFGELEARWHVRLEREASQYFLAEGMKRGRTQGVYRAQMFFIKPARYVTAFFLRGW